MRINKILFLVLLATTFLLSKIVATPSNTLIYTLDISNYNSIDTIPLLDSYDDFINRNYYNPFDIQPKEIKQEVEYDAQTGRYLISEKIGNEYYRMPTYMNTQEYLQWSAKTQESRYFNNLGGITKRSFGKIDQLDPVAKIDIKEQLVNRLFGSGGVKITPHGNIDFSLGASYRKQQLTGNKGVNSIFYFPDTDMKINVGLDGKVGDKINLGFNFNSQATFDFDNKFKLDYLSDAFSEDDIIKSIEVGNVSMPLKSSLIRGSQNLFGIKTTLQFGKLFITGLLSQARSQNNDIVVKNGSQQREFKIRPDEYDEYRHFFISHYHRDAYEGALQNLPQVNSQMKITNVEVWVTIQNNELPRNTRHVTAIQFLGESEIQNYNDTTVGLDIAPNNLNFYKDNNGRILPNNENADVYREIVTDENLRISKNTISQMKQLGIKENSFETQKMRRLEPNEYYFNPELGFLSLNVRIQPNQVLGVAYEYTYLKHGNKVFKVGEMTNESNYGGFTESADTAVPGNTLFVKLLKPSSNATNTPSWDLMMKNVYSLGSNQINKEDFKLDIYFEDNTNSSLKRYIPEESLRTIPLLDLFNLDRLNSYNDPQPDGEFDYLPGITVIERTGSVIFPVLEPFGSSLEAKLGDKYEQYGFPQLYEDGISVSKEALSKNKFVITGSIKSGNNADIQLDAFNIPRGSIRVTAGSQTLREGIDYDVDYGLGRIKIINQAYISQGVPVRVSFENQSLFNLQQKTMLGLRAEYRANEKLTVGGTILRLFERPYTQKVNIGSDPINNKIYGLDLNYSNNAPFLTKLVDKLPFISTKAESRITISAEVAALKPGHNKAINAEGSKEAVVSIDDFEGAGNSLPLSSSENQWSLASPPQDAYLGNRVTEERFPESKLENSLVSNANRALISWYVNNDYSVASGQTHPYTRLIRQNELFDRDIEVGITNTSLRTFDLNYYPQHRGPYNFDLPAGTLVGNLGQRTGGVRFDPASQSIRLNNPEDRWAGIMRYLPTTDFQTANYQYIEFWMLNPFMERPDGSKSVEGEEGYFVFNLGDISEDVMKDNLQFYENALPTGDEGSIYENTVYGRVPLNTPSIRGFDIDKINNQDLGLDGISDIDEQIKFKSYIDQISTLGIDQSIILDPANDNYESYLSTQVVSRSSNYLDRFRKYNNTQGNVPKENESLISGNRLPDAEDLNNNRSLETKEQYFQYVLKLKNTLGKIDIANNPYITEEKEISNGAIQESWYRVQIPIQQDPEKPSASFNKVNDIDGFRSIQFLRMYFTGFNSAKTFRIAEFELVRNQWRILDSEKTKGVSDVSCGDFVLDQIGIQENKNKKPFSYILPPGIQLERYASTFSTISQDENSLNLRFKDLKSACNFQIYKHLEMDMRYFKRLQLYSHAEKAESTIADNGDLALFIKVGKDFTENYYEYEIPMTFSDPSSPNIKDSLDGSQSQTNYANEVWKNENKIDFPFELFQNVKIERNKNGASITELYSLADGDPNKLGASVNIKGNPSLGYIKGIVIGVRNKKDNSEITGEVWVNELRLSGLEEKAAYSGLARMDMQLADLGNLSMSGQFSTIGWGALEETVTQRQLDKKLNYDVAANLELGKFLPKNAGITIPFYFQYAKEEQREKYDPFELDLTKEQLLTKSTLTDEEKQDIEDRQAKSTSIKTINFTNVKKSRSSNAGSPMPWDIANFSASYSYTETKLKDEIIKENKTNDRKLSIDYIYATNGINIQPLSGINSKSLRFLKQLNFNPLPNSFVFGTQMRKYANQKIYRQPYSFEGFRYLYDDNRFTWDRTYGLQWNLTKGIRINYNAKALSVIDELKRVGVDVESGADIGIDNRKLIDVYGNDRNIEGKIYSNELANNSNYAKKYTWNNIKKFGRIKSYDQSINLNYTLPFKYFPVLNFIDGNFVYTGSYTWSAGSLVENSYRNLSDLTDDLFLGNTISNDQEKNLNLNFNFEKLYKNSNYIQSLDGKSDRRKKEIRNVSVIEKILVRPLLMIRDIRISLRENESSLIPGFLPHPTNFGLGNKLSAPGLGFVFGVQPNLNLNDAGNWLTKAENKKWLSISNLQNKEILQNKTQNYDLNVHLEPWKDFDIKLTFNKRYLRNHSEYFVDTSGTGSNFNQFAQRDLGSYETNYSTLSTLFGNKPEDLFEKFKSYRSIISRRLPNNTNETIKVSGEVYGLGYGPENADVIIPAFLAAYTGKDPNNFNLNITDKISKRSYLPSPDWKINYNGLAKLPGLKEIFKSVTIAHGYSSKLTVTEYKTDLQYDLNNPYYIDPTISSGNYFSRFEIPQITISTQFQPLLGIDVKAANDMTFRFDYVKLRNLGFFTSTGELNEVNTTGITFGFGWTVENFSLFGNKNAKNTRENNEAKAPRAQNQLIFKFDLSIQDEITLRHYIQPGKLEEKTRGSKNVKFEPIIEYLINQNFSLLANFRYLYNKPYNSNSYPNTQIEGYLTARFKLN